MSKAKAWIAGAAAAVALVGCGGGASGGHKAATPPTSAPAPATSDVQPNDQVTQQLITNLMNQITQATNAGQPQVITKEQAEELLRQQLQQLGVRPPK